MALDFLAGCIGGCAGVLSSHPLDTLKVHVQTGRGKPMECVRSIMSQGSFSAFYRGVGPPIISVAGTNALVFGTCGIIRRSLPDSNSIASHTIAGTFSGIVQSFLTSPVELIKTRQQLARFGDAIPSGTIGATKFILKTEGFRGLFRGLGITILRDAPGFGVYFASYEAMTRGNKSAWRVFAAGGLAGAVSWMVCYPIDVIKSRFQADTGWKSAWECAITSIRKEGLSCLSRGLGPVMLRAILCNGTIFAAVSWTERAYELWTAESAYSTFLYAAALNEAIHHHDLIDFHGEYITNYY